MTPAPKPFPFVKVIAVVITAIVIVLLCSSCATQGYGCKGRGKIITRVKQF